MSSRSRSRGQPASPWRVLCGGSVRLRRRADRCPALESPAHLARGGHGAHRRGPAPRRPVSALPRAARARAVRRRAAGRRGRRRAGLLSARRGGGGGRGAARAGHARGRPLRGLQAARPRRARALVRTARRARSCAASPCSASPSCTATRSPRASLVANPGCYSTAAILALAPLARAGLIADAVVDAKSGVSGAGREANERTHFVVGGRERERIRGRRPPPRARDRPGAGRARPRRRVTFVPHLLPLDQGLLASCYVTPSRELRARGGRGAVRGRVRRRALHRAGRRAARRARRARHEHLPHPRDHRAGRARARVRRDRQPLEGRGRPGRAEPEPDARARRGRGPAMSAAERHLLSLALGRCAGRRGASSTPGRCRAGFARPGSPAG